MNSNSKSPYWDAALSLWGTIILVLGALMNSFNLYPHGIITMSFGSALWLIAAILRKDMPLAFTNGIMIFVSLIGVIIKLMEGV